jgi:hypothetical protein
VLTGEDLLNLSCAKIFNILKNKVNRLSKTADNEKNITIASE